MDFPDDLSLFDLKNIVDNKETLRQFLINKGLIFDYSELRCFLCDTQLTFAQDISRKTGYIYRCNNRHCRKFKLVETFGSWFDSSKLEVGKILLLTYLWASGNVESSFIKDNLGLSGQTVVDWSNYCREVCVDLLGDNSYSQIGGEGVQVEIDESHFGKRKFHKGKRVEGVWVFGGVERGKCENSFFEVVENRSEDTLVRLIVKYIRKGSIILSDCWKGYNTDRLVELGYTHGTVNHSKHFKDPVSGVHTNTIESTWHHLKHFKHHRLSKELRAGYFAEFIFRRKFFRNRDSNNLSKLGNFSIFIREGINKVYNKERALVMINDKWGNGGDEGGGAASKFQKRVNDDEDHQEGTSRKLKKN